MSVEDQASCFGAVFPSTWLMVVMAIGTGCASQAVVPVRGFVVPGRAVVVDLTHPMGAWPAESAAGTTPVAEDRSGAMSEASLRVATRFEAPATSSPGGIAVDRFPAGRLVGPAVVVDVASRVEVDPDYLLSVDDLLGWEGRNGPLPPGAIIIMRSGWGVRWGKVEERDGDERDLLENEDSTGVAHFPGLSPAAARRLAAIQEFQGVGVDTPDVGGAEPATGEAVRRALHAAGRFTLANLANLERLPESGAVLIVAPPRLQGAERVPARVLALVPRG